MRGEGNRPEQRAQDRVEDRKRGVHGTENEACTALTQRPMTAWQRVGVRTRRYRPSTRP
jgi:hypothetical protein